jgi:hypothetical protein
LDTLEQIEELIRKKLSGTQAGATAGSGQQIR